MAQVEKASLVAETEVEQAVVVEKQFVAEVEKTEAVVAELVAKQEIADVAFVADKKVEDTESEQVVETVVAAVELLVAWQAAGIEAVQVQD